MHGGCPPASITQKRPNHGQVSIHGEPKFIEGQQPGGGSGGVTLLQNAPKAWLLWAVASPLALWLVL